MARILRDLLLLFISFIVKWYSIKTAKSGKYDELVLFNALMFTSCLFLDVVVIVNLLYDYGIITL